MTPFTVRTTERGFECVEFRDVYWVRCVLQQVSRHDSEAIWLGRYDTTLGGARMVLNREHVQALVAMMSHWLDTGSIRMEPEGEVGA